MSSKVVEKDVSYNVRPDRNVTLQVTVSNAHRTTGAVVFLRPSQRDPIHWDGPDTGQIELGKGSDIEDTQVQVVVMAWKVDRSTPNEIEIVVTMKGGNNPSVTRYADSDFEDGERVGFIIDYTLS